MNTSADSVQPDLGIVPITTPELSFAIPAYNRPELLLLTLESIVKQTGLENYEIVVTDDLGLPETATVIENLLAHPITYYRNPARLGGIGNWNHCLHLARGRWVTLLHEDDCLYPWFYQLIREHLAPDIAAVCPRSILGSEQPDVPAPDPARSRTRSYKPAYFLKSAFTPFPGVVFRRELLDSLHGFDPAWESLADYDFWYRLNVAGPVQIVQAIGCFYRVSDRQWTAEEWPNMLRKSHHIRLRIVREQFGNSRLARWIARFFTYRNARSYARRFPERPATLHRCLEFEKIPLSRLPSGWVWLFLKFISRRPLRTTPFGVRLAD